MSLSCKPDSTRIYRPDGTGRDAYILADNGGNTIRRKNAPATRSGTLFISPDREFKAKPEYSPSKNFTRGGMAFSAANVRVPPHYLCNGTGRDSYIGATSGGFTVDRFVPQANPKIYMNSLRK